MTIILILMLLGSDVSLEAVSDGSGFIELYGLWPEPGTITAIVDSDTIYAEAGASGPRSGIRLTPVPIGGEMIILTFDTLEITIEPSAELVIPMLVDEPVIIQAFTRTPIFQQQGLFISGSKKIGFSVGENSGLDQGTRIAIDGYIAPGISVSGSVTDRNLLTGTSSSELISQLDRVLIEVDGGHWHSKLGDLTWESGNGNSGPLAWRQDISGVEFGGDVQDQTFSGNIGYGTTGDERECVVFYTTEGIAGPYEIAGNAEIVSGSEKVWLDGELLSRGSSADYTMEYSAGFITFTSRRLLHDGQRVEITFLQRGDGFRKDIINVDAGYSGESFQITFLGFSQDDRTDAPIGFVLSEEAEEILRNAGEDPTEAWIDGAEYVGENNGSYTLNNLSYYTYAGPGMGDWTVIFNRPTEEPGDYIYSSSLSGYVWVGEGLGTHLPRQYIQIPTSYRNGGLITSFNTDHVSSEITVSISEKIGNLFNSDSTTRTGTCVLGHAGYDLFDNGPGLQFTGQFTSSGYNAPTQLEPDSSLSSWQLPIGYSGNDNIASVAFGSERFFLTAGGRFISDGGILERYEIFASPFSGIFQTEINAAYLQRSNTTMLVPGDYKEIEGDFSIAAGCFTPVAGFDASIEEWQDSLSGGRNSVYAGLSFLKSGNNLTFRAEYQSDSREGEIPHPESVWRVRLEGSGSFSPVNYRGSFEHSTSSFEDTGSLQADAISFTISGSIDGIWMQSVYSGSGIVSRALEVIYVWVGEGLGSYSYDPEAEEYYPDIDGDYDISYQPGDAGDTINEASFETSLSKYGDENGITGNLRISASGSEKLSAFLLYGAFDTLSAGGYRMSLSPWWNWDYGVLRRFTLSGSVSDERVSYSGTGLREEKKWELGITPVFLLSDELNVECSGEIWREEENLYSTHDISGFRIEADPSRVAFGEPEPGLLLAWEHRTESTAGYKADCLEIKPHINWMADGWITAGSINMRYIESIKEMPVWFFDGYGTGYSWQINGRVGKNISSEFTITLFYSGRKYSEQNWTQSAGLEGTVNF